MKEKQLRIPEEKVKTTEVAKGIGIVIAAALLVLSFYVGKNVAALTVSSQGTILSGTTDWGVGFGEEGTKPRGDVSSEELKKHNAYYLSDTQDKRVYLTFDCGYENGNTEAILDALKKHHAKATFFVVGHYLNSAPDQVKRMVEEGHTVGNHTYHHPDMSKISGKDAFTKELEQVEEKFCELTGKEMASYYRPPQGKFNESNLDMAKDLGYTTFFWSLAYKDWDVKKQPSSQDAINLLCKRVHPGAIVLLHNTSKTNGEILDELLTKWENMGYSFGTLDEFLEEKVTPEEGMEESASRL